MERLFATQHNWARSGTVLNLKSGPSYMLMETNGGKGLVKEFAAANTTFQYQTH
jgi:hypothetical protein